MGFDDSDGFLGPRFISSEKIPLNGDYNKQIIRIPIQQPSIMEYKFKRVVFVAQDVGGEMIYAPGN